MKAFNVSIMHELNETDVLNTSEHLKVAFKTIGKEKNSEKNKTKLPFVLGEGHLKIFLRFYLLLYVSLSSWVFPCFDVLIALSQCYLYRSTLALSKRSVDFVIFFRIEIRFDQFFYKKKRTGNALTSPHQCL